MTIKTYDIDPPFRRKSEGSSHVLNQLESLLKMGSKNNTLSELKEDAANGLLENSTSNGYAKVIPGEKILIKEDTVGCTHCDGKKLVGFSKIKYAPKLCWNRDVAVKNYRCILVSSVIVFFLCLLGGVFLLFTDAFNSLLISKMVLANNTQAFDLWREPPVHPIMKVHVFNYTNAMEVMDGKEKKLRVEDIGPYVYEETLKKVNIVFNPNGTVTYQNRKTFKLLPEKSVGAQFDKFVVPNLPMLSAISMVKESYFVAQMGLSTLFTTLKTKPFRELPVHRYLWGYEDELVNLAKNFITLAPNMPTFDKFGLLITMNGTSSDVITINTGANDMNKFAIIDRYNGYYKLPHWGTDECNRVDASDGSMFPPSMVDGKQRLYIYNEQVCRRLPFQYEKEVEVLDSVKAKRYSVPDDVFASPDINPENQCFCHMDSGTCPPNGLFNSSPCAFGAPVLASFPHFYLGDQSIIDSIDGLDPTPDKHAMYMDIHPSLGLPITGINRIQLNMQLRKSNGISGSGLDNIPNNIILPVMWIEFTVEDLPPIIKSLIYHGTYSANAVKTILTWVCIIGLVVSGFIIFFVTKNQILHRKRSQRIPLPVITTKT